MTQPHWKPPTVESRWRWWMTYRVPPVIALVVSAMALAYLVWQPFQHARTYLLFGLADYPPAVLPPHVSPGDELAAIRTPYATLVNQSGATNTVAPGSLASPGALEATFGQLEQHDIRSSDILITWIGAQCVSHRGEVDLLCGNCDPMDVQSGRYPLAKLIARIQECPASTKLLVLDSGWTVHAPRLAIFDNCLLQQIRSLVEETKDQTLWVLVTHSDFEESFTLGEPRRSVFAYFMGEALQGAADRNNDHFVDLGELYHYTKDKVADWVRAETSGRSTQTAMLYWGGGQRTVTMAYPVVAPVPPKKPIEKTADGVEIAAPTVPHISKSFSPRTAAGLTVFSTSASTPAANPTAKSDKPDAKDQPKDQAAAKSSADPVLAANPAELQAMAWALHDRVAAAPEFHAIDGMPQFWRALQDRLLWPAPTTLTAAKPGASSSELRRLVRQLSDLAEGRPPQSFQQHDLIPLMAQWAEPIEVEPAFPTLALAERLGRPMPAAALAAAQRLDAVVEKPDSAEFQKWMAELPAAFDVYTELRLARRMAARSDLDWSSICLALKTRRLAERVAAETLMSGLWTREQIERADRLRLSGERGLLVGVRPSDAARSVILLGRAKDEYEQAAAWNQDVLTLKNLTSEALFCYPDYLRWEIATLADSDSVSPDMPTLDLLLRILTRVLPILERPASDRLPDVRRLRHEFETIMARLRQRTAGDSTNTQQTEAAPAPQASSLEAAALRVRLMELPDLSRDLGVGLAKSLTSNSRRDPLQRLRQAATLYAAFNRLVLRNLAETDSKAKNLMNAASFGDRLTPAQELYKACSNYGEALAEVLQSLPESIQRISVDSQDLSDPSQRAAQLQKLTAARWLLYLVHPWDVPRMDYIGPTQCLRRAEYYDLFAWQQKRFATEIEDAPSIDLAELVRGANYCRRAAVAMPLQPPIVEVMPPRIEVSSPAQLDLASKFDLEFPVTVVNRQDHQVALWLAADYDASYVSLQARDEEPLYDMAALGRISNALSQLSVDTKRPMASPPTFTLQGGESKALWVQLRRKTLAGGDARFSFHALTSTDLVRRDLTAVLPHRLAIDIVADGIAETWQPQEAALVFYPFPNSTTSYTLSLVNSGPLARVVNFELLRPDAPITIAAPVGDVAGDVADKYLARLGNLTRLHNIEKIAVAPGGQRVPIPFVPPPDPQAKPVAPVAVPIEKMPPLASNLLAVITDTSTGRKLIKRIDIFTQRPARYVHSNVVYDPEQRRVDFVVRPVKPSAMPARGVWVEAQTSVSDLENKRSVGAWLLPTTPEVTLHMEMPGEITGAYIFYLNVDGFDRAFRYELPRGVTTRTPVAELTRVGVRIVDPPSGTCYGPKTTEVPVALQIDAPHGLLLDEDGFVEVGVDTNRDRELRHKQTIRLTSDRHVDLLEELAGANGAFSIKTRLSDLRVTLPPPMQKSMRANLLARLNLANNDVWSQPIEVIFDDEPPVLSQLQVMPGAKVEQGTVLDISAIASDNLLSGIAKVEVGVDEERKGEFGAPGPTKCVLQSDGRWSTKMPTKGLDPGVYGILARATDRVGNTSRYLKSSIEVTKVVSNSKVKKPVLGQITGRVVYGRFEKRPVGGAVVKLAGGKDEKLEATTDDDGQFKFTDLAPGDYKLNVEKLITGNRRSTQADAKIANPPVTVPPVELILVMPK